MVREPRTSRQWLTKGRLDASPVQPGLQHRVAAHASSPSLRGVDPRIVIACAVVALAGCGSAGGGPAGGAWLAATPTAPLAGRSPERAPWEPSPIPHEPGLRDSVVVCTLCTPQLLAAKREGIVSALAALLDLLGSDISPTVAPITFHLDSDATCDAWQMLREKGFLSGYSKYDKQGHAVVCLFDVEKPNRMLPFTPENARTRADQLLPLHEAGHIWLGGRANPYAVQEPLVKLVSFLVSGAILDPCRTFRVEEPPDNLIAGLCDSGATLDEVPAICRGIARAARAKGSALTNDETAVVVSGVIGADARPAFHASGLL